MLSKALENLEALTDAFDRPIGEAERDILQAWESGVRDRVLSRTPEPCAEPIRWRLADERKSLTHHFELPPSSSEHSVFDGYITTGMYPSGRIGEIFLLVSKEGTFARALLDAFVTAVSISLQHGIPLQVFVDKFRATRFQPNGHVQNAPTEMFPDRGMKVTTSILDYLSRYLAWKFPGGVWSGEPERDENA